MSGPTAESTRPCKALCCVLLGCVAFCLSRLPYSARSHFKVSSPATSAGLPPPRFQSVARVFHYRESLAPPGLSSEMSLCLTSTQLKAPTKLIHANSSKRGGFQSHRFMNRRQDMKTRYDLACALYAKLCYAMLCCALLCSAILCYAMLCYAMLC